MEHAIKDNPDLEGRIRYISASSTPRQYADEVPHETDTQIDPANYLAFVLKMRFNDSSYQRVGVTSYQQGAVSYDTKTQGAASDELNFDYLLKPASIDAVASSTPELYLRPAKGADETVYGLSKPQKDEKRVYTGIERFGDALKRASGIARKIIGYLNHYSGNYRNHDSDELDGDKKEKPHIVTHAQEIALAMKNNRDSSPELSDHVSGKNALARSIEYARENTHQEYAGGNSYRTTNPRERLEHSLGFSRASQVGIEDTGLKPLKPAYDAKGPDKASYHTKGLKGA
ncbi:MAG TPA: hypothetical protein VJI46_02075 [Candidatus Nanoarchaeia archaeon]|nr:hypothetical protein [Candidatus Nanoarchaeia archaeon]